MVKDVLESGHLHPAMAGKLLERMGLSCTQMFGPFSRRQREHGRFWLNHQLTSALSWWLEILSRYLLAWYLLICRSVAELSRIAMEKGRRQVLE